ncbi:MAG TPA: DUF1992 domain-containing protein [Candidatus Limnocylindrales bacterium]|nr:DUF1992 domain-containing protein [Candidatus Limnocylindrales bacterium]
MAKRRDAEGKISVGPTWESIVERQIREAMEEGRFDELPYRGEPLPGDDDSAAGERALGFRVLRNAGVAPPWIEADKEVRALLADRDALLARAARAGESARPRLRREIEGIVGAANRAIERLNSEAPTERQHRRLLTSGRSVRSWRRHSGAEQTRVGQIPTHGHLGQQGSARRGLSAAESALCPAKFSPGETLATGSADPCDRTWPKDLRVQLWPRN